MAISRCEYRYWLWKNGDILLTDNNLVGGNSYYYYNKYSSLRSIIINIIIASSESFQGGSLCGSSAPLYFVAVCVIFLNFNLFIQIRLPTKFISFAFDCHSRDVYGFLLPYPPHTGSVRKYLPIGMNACFVQIIMLQSPRMDRKRQWRCYSPGNAEMLTMTWSSTSDSDTSCPRPIRSFTAGAFRTPLRFITPR